MACDVFKPLHAHALQGEYTGATNTEDDLAIINRYLPYVTDDYSNTAGTATTITSGKPARCRLQHLSVMLHSWRDNLRRLHCPANSWPSVGTR